jgi:L-2-hydroxyglutarate oxidase
MQLEMKNKTYDLVICGAGATGLASAWQIRKYFPNLKIAILDKASEVAAHQTGNNSGVIHSGIYYKPGGSKAVNCRKGYAYLLSFCKEYGVPHEVCGKVIVATDESELSGLDRIMESGKANGLDGLKFLDSEETKAIEPNVECLKSIYVPQAGIIDYKALCEILKANLEALHVDFLLGHELVDISRTKDKIKLETSSGSLESSFLINCAGLYADNLAEKCGFEIDFRIIPFRGEYYEFKKEYEHLVKHLIYPVPDPKFPFLGVHFTRMQRGGIEAGPNAVLALKREGYKKLDFNLKEFIQIMFYKGTVKLGLKHWRKGLDEYYRSFSKRAFVQTLKRMIPTVHSEMFVQGGSGVRAQAIDKEGNLMDEFLILSDEQIINLCNAPSPAATSCFAIGEQVKEHFEKIYT